MTQFPNLLSPLSIGKIEVRNRILVSAQVPGFAKNHKPGKKYTAYHSNYARNGVGLQITGGTPVHHSGLLSTNTDALRNFDDGIIPGYQLLSDAVHAEGIIADGQEYMVGMTRANICDPQLVAKIKRNEIKRIRPCVGANTCIANR